MQVLNMMLSTSSVAALPQIVLNQTVHNCWIVRRLSCTPTEVVDIRSVRLSGKKIPAITRPVPVRSASNT